VCNGGIYWDIKKTYKNAVTNELAIECSFLLFKLLNEEYYLNWTIKLSDWLLNSKIVDNVSGVIHDGLNFDLKTKKCDKLNSALYTYN